MDMSKKLSQAYKNALYIVNLNDDLAITLRVKQENKALDFLLEKNNNSSWAFITAFNPYGQQQTNEINLIKNEELLKYLTQRGYKFLRGYGTCINHEWPQEKSVLVFDVSQDEARKIGTYFKQHCVVFGFKNKTAFLLLCNN